MAESQQHRSRNLGYQRRHCGCEWHSPPEHLRADCLRHQRLDLRGQCHWQHEQQQAYWLSANTIGWDPLVTADEVYLHAAPTGGLLLDDTGISGGTVYTLTQNGVITGDIAAKFPHLAGIAAWELAPADAALAADLLTGQIAVSAFAADALVDATGLQIPGVLDDLYAADAYNETLGVVWAGSTPTLKLWAPTAKSVTLHLFADANPATSSVTETMTLDANSGVWSVTGDSSWKNNIICTK